MIPVLVVFMLINGKPVGDTMHLYAVKRGCETELATIRGINKALADNGVEFVATCEDRI